MRRFLLSTVACLALLAACSDRDGGRRNPDAGPPDAGGGVDAPPPRDTGPLTDAGPRLDDVLIFAHSRDTLYTFSPYTLTVDTVGPFLLPDGSPAPYMLDLAVDSDGRVFTSSDTSLFSVDPESARVTLVGDLGLGSDELFALSFLARGEYRAGEETLVGATNEGVYYEVNPATAVTRPMGTYPDGWRSSGDIVSVAGLGTFATVRRADFPSDVLVQILFAADGSSTVTVRGPIRSATEDFIEVFGLGYWGRDMYGFSNAGQLIQIDRDSGAAMVVSTDTGASQFWGAGVTTRVPVLF